jgi:hypothetical protein
VAAGSRDRPGHVGQAARAHENKKRPELTKQETRRGRAAEGGRVRPRARGRRHLGAANRYLERSKALQSYADWEAGADSDALADVVYGLANDELCSFGLRLLSRGPE